MIDGKRKGCAQSREADGNGREAEGRGQRRSRGSCSPRTCQLLSMVWVLGASAFNGQRGFCGATQLRACVLMAGSGFSLSACLRRWGLSAMGPLKPPPPTTSRITRGRQPDGSNDLMLLRIFLRSEDAWPEGCASLDAAMRNAAMLPASRLRCSFGWWVTCWRGVAGRQRTIVPWREMQARLVCAMCGA